MSDISDKISQLTTAIAGFIESATALILAPRERAQLVTSSDKLDDKELSEVIGDVSGVFVPHITDTTTNPHNLTVGTINAFTTAEFTDTVKTYVPKQQFFLSRYGRLTQSLPTFSVDGWVVVIDMTEVIMEGYKHELIGILDLTTIKPDPSNSNFTVFVESTGAAVGYVIEETTPLAPPDRIDRMRIGNIITTSNSVSVNLENVTRIGQYRLSHTPTPYGIPVSMGVPMNYAGLIW